MSTLAATYGLWLFSAPMFSLANGVEATERLDYVADVACPTRAEFVRAVDERAKDPKLAAAIPFESVSVRLRSNAAGFVGQLELRLEDGSVLQRELRDASCDALARALAFVLVIALREHAESSSVRREALPPRDERPAALSGPAPEPSGFRFGFGVEFGARSAIAPFFAPFEVAEAELREEARGFPAWTFHAAFVRMQAAEYDARYGSVDFQWNAGRWEICPLRVALALPLDFVPCLGGHIGAVEASGHPATPKGKPAAPTLFWLDGLAALRLELRVAKVAVMGLRGELNVPITQYGFVFYDPYSPVFRTPGLGIAASAVVRVAFP